MFSQPLRGENTVRLGTPLARREKSYGLAKINKNIGFPYVFLPWQKGLFAVARRIVSGKQWKNMHFFNGRSRAPVGAGLEILRFTKKLRKRW